MLRITYIRNKCIGCNACVEAAPERWRISRKDGKSTLIEGEERGGIFYAQIHDDEYQRNIQAASNCPVKIIKVDEL